MKRCLPFGVVLVGLIVFSGLSLLSADVTVGVKVGDWIEYDVSTTGIPPSPHDVQWARMDIIDVSGSNIRVNVTTQANNGTYSTNIMQLNLQRGEIGAWFIIPANLNVGQSFYDLNLGRNITIEGEQQLSYAGAVRAVTNATIPERIKQWDKETGIFLQSIDTLPGYTINATAIRTNMWGSQVLGLDETVLLVISLVIGLVALAVVVVIVRKKR